MDSNPLILWWEHFFPVFSCEYKGVVMSVIDEDEKLVDHRRKDVTTEIYKKRFNIKENYGNVNKFMVVSNKLWKNRVKEKGSNEPWKLQIFKFLITNAILEGTQKQCSDYITDGKELRNSYILSVTSQHFSIASVCLQGHSRKQCLRWLIFTSGFESRNSYGFRLVASA